MWKRYFSNTIF